MEWSSTPLDISILISCMRQAKDFFTLFFYVLSIIALHPTGWSAAMCDCAHCNLLPNSSNSPASASQLGPCRPHHFCIFKRWLSPVGLNPDLRLFAHSDSGHHLDLKDTSQDLRCVLGIPTAIVSSLWYFVHKFPPQAVFSHLGTKWFKGFRLITWVPFSAVTHIN